MGSGHKGLSSQVIWAHYVVEAVAGDDEDILRNGLPLEAVEDVVQVLPHRVRRAAVPAQGVGVWAL